MKLLLALVNVPNTGANGAPLVGVAPAVLKFKQGATAEQVTVPLGVATGLVETKYPVVFTPVKFVWLARLNTSAVSSRPYFSRKVNCFESLRSCTYVLGRRKVLRPTASIRNAPLDPLTPPSDPGAEPLDASE